MHTTEFPSEPSAPMRVLRGRSRWLRLAFGVVTLIAGVLVVAWPGATLLVAAVLVGIQLIVGGIVRAATAFTYEADSGAARVLFLLFGVLLVVLGILFLREPLRSVAVLVLLFGVSCVVGGALELFQGFTGGGGRTIASGLVSIVVGIVVLAYPVSTVSTMIWLFGISLAVIGLTAVLATFSPARSRAGATQAPPRSAPPAAPATP